MNQITLIKTGDAIPVIAQQYGDFEDWFNTGLGVSGLRQVDVFKNQPLPDLENTSGIVITGSAAMVSHQEEWSENTAQWLQQAVVNGVPVLGVCYGHQLLAHALGGKVGPNPKGRQIGTVTTSLLDAVEGDPLLGHLPRKFPAQTSHLEVVLELPAKAVRLGTSSLDENFVIRFADRVWGVQFHPEFSDVVMSRYIEFRSELIDGEGLSSQALLSTVTDSPEASSILEKFTEVVATG